jgi:signal transduction histidine kinase
VGLLADAAQTQAARDAALARVRTSLLGMSQMIGDLLEYTRTRLGKVMPVDAAPANVEAIVRESLAEVVAGHPQHSFRLEMGTDLHAVVDSARLQQAITNLLGNAIEHGRLGASIEVIAHKDGGSLAIEVTNEGPTISADALRVLFDPFGQDDTREAIGQGAAPFGLGLFIARAIARSHGGGLEVNSGNDETTFRLVLPRGAEPEAPGVELRAYLRKNLRLAGPEFATLKKR